MKQFLEEEQTIDGEKSIVHIRELSPSETIKQIKVPINKKQYIHTCYHDEGKGRPCKREEIK